MFAWVAAMALSAVAQPSVGTTTTAAATATATATATVGVDAVLVAAPQPAATSSSALADAAPAGLGVWAGARSRRFLAATVDVGFLYLRPRGTIGYGQPHFAWIGAEANPIISLNGVGGYVGVRGALPRVDLRVGARGFYALERSFLAPSPSFDRLALSTTTNGNAAYVTLEAELNANMRLGPGELSGLASLSAIEGVPDGQYVFEETLRVVAKPPWVWRGRASYAWFPFTGARHSIAPVVDVLGVPGRDAFIVRAGVVLRLLISPTVELRGTFIPTVHSPDQIGLLDSDFTELGVRWRWASEP